jgi:hypothetical protein
MTSRIVDPAGNCNQKPFVGQAQIRITSKSAKQSARTAVSFTSTDPPSPDHRSTIWCTRCRERLNSSATAWYVAPDLIAVEIACSRDTPLASASRITASAEFLRRSLSLRRAAASERSTRSRCAMHGYTAPRSRLERPSTALRVVPSCIPVSAAERPVLWSFSSLLSRFGVQKLSAMRLIGRIPRGQSVLTACRFRNGSALSVVYQPPSCSRASAQAPSKELA